MRPCKAPTEPKVQEMISQGSDAQRNKYSLLQYKYHSVDVDNLFHQQPPSLESGLIFEIIEDTKQLQTHLIHPDYQLNGNKTRTKSKTKFPSSKQP